MHCTKDIPMITEKQCIIILICNEQLQFMDFDSKKKRKKEKENFSPAESTVPSSTLHNTNGKLKTNFMYLSPSYEFINILCKTSIFGYKLWFHGQRMLSDFHDQSIRRSQLCNRLRVSSNLICAILLKLLEII